MEACVGGWHMGAARSVKACADGGKYEICNSESRACVRDD